MNETKRQKMKEAFLRRHPDLTELVDHLMQTEDATALLQRFGKIEQEQNDTEDS